MPDPSNPQAWNRFSYVSNRPVNFNDPTGHFSCSHDPNSDDYCPPSGGSSRPSTNPLPRPDKDDEEEVGVFTEEELLELGIDCGNNVAELTCQLYTNPSAFNFEMQVQFSAWVYAFINPNTGTYLACQIVWQGCISAGNTYIMLPTTVSNPNGGVDWNRNAVLDGVSDPLFYANWQVGSYNGAPAAIERFPMRGGDLGHVTAYLSPSARNNGIVWSSSDINYNIYGVSTDISISPFEIIFETQQTGLNSIITVGQLKYGGNLAGQITISGTLK